MINKLDSALSFHQDALRIRAKRQEIIAANIANADTPNFKARDIDFKAAMNNALQSNKQAASGLIATDAQHLQGNGALGSNINAELLYRPIIQGSVDGNTVDMDVERNQFTDNAIRYEASLTMINGQLKKMLAAIQGQ